MLLMLSLMCGGSFFRIAYDYLDKSSFSVSKVVSLLCILSFSFILFGNNYNTILAGYMLFEAAIGLLYPVYSKIKSQFLPKENRGTLMNLFKTPFNIVVITLLITTNKVLTIKGFWTLCLIFSILALTLQVIFFTSDKENKEIDNDISNKTKNRIDKNKLKTN